MNRKVEVDDALPIIAIGQFLVNQFACHVYYAFSANLGKRSYNRFNRCNLFSNFPDYSVYPD
jgi:hypothetical protein